MRRLYVKSDSKWNSLSQVNYVSNESLNVQTVDNGIILPIKKINGVYRGGVCDSDLHFKAGRSAAWCGVKDNYAISKPDGVIKETVLFGGVIMLHFGHMLVDSMTRLWWLTENQYTGLVVFLVEWGDLKPWVYEWFQLLGLDKDRIVFIFPRDKAVCYEKVIIPSESITANGYTEKYLLPAQYMAANALKLVDVKSLPNKIYLTRSHFQGGATTYIANEDYIEKFFLSKGYKCISTEEFSVAEQVAMLANAKAVATNLGTLSHLILFSTQGIKCDIWLRDNYILPVQMAIFQLKNADWRLVDAEMSFLPHTHIQGITLCGPTHCWKEYVREYWRDKVSSELALSDADIADYVKKWAEYFVKYPEVLRQMNLQHFSFFDSAVSVCENFLDVDIRQELSTQIDSYSEIKKKCDMFEKKLQEVRKLLCDDLIDLHGADSASYWLLDSDGVWMKKSANGKEILCLGKDMKYSRIHIPFAYELSQGDVIKFYIAYSMRSGSGIVRLMAVDVFGNYFELSRLRDSEAVAAAHGEVVCPYNRIKALMLTSTDFVGNNSYISFEVISLKAILKGD